MKHLNKLFAAALLFAGLTSQAQDSNNPWAVSFGVNGVDTKVSAVGNDSPKFIQLLNAKENWNILPSVSYLNVSRYVGDGFSFGLTGSVNKIDKWVTRDLTTESTDIVSDPGDLSYYAFDATIKYSFMELLKSKWLDPSINIGGGYNFLGDASAGTVNGGLGLTFWLTEQVGLQLQSTYKHSFDDNRTPNADIPTHIQHFAGLTFKFGGKDTDGDGIYDKDDACPEVAGLPEFKGCPDTDKDGIQDSEDACIDEPGTKELNGCPDNDGDGIINKEDACIDEKGTKMMNGCPDADGDGVADKDDKCLDTQKGVSVDAKGCPLDMDGDGIADYLDKCPDTPKNAKVDDKGCPVDSDGDGIADYLDNCPDTSKGAKVDAKGCPIIEETAEEIEAENMKVEPVYFDSNKSAITAQEKVKIDKLVNLLQENSDYKVKVNGYADAQGADNYNLNLSESRVSSVVKSIISGKIKKERIVQQKGFGEANPAATNDTPEGRALNRRVEFEVFKTK